MCICSFNVSYTFAPVYLPCFRAKIDSSLFFASIFFPLRGKRKHWRNNNRIYVRITRNKISPAENIRDDYFDARKKEAKLNKAREREREREGKKG